MPSRATTAAVSRPSPSTATSCGSSAPFARYQSVPVARSTTHRLSPGSQDGCDRSVPLTRGATAALPVRRPTYTVLPSVLTPATRPASSVTAGVRSGGDPVPATPGTGSNSPSR